MKSHKDVYWAKVREMVLETGKAPPSVVDRTIKKLRREWERRIGNIYLHSPIGETAEGVINNLEDI